MKSNAITPQTAQRFYDWLGAKHDWGSGFERKAKDRALALLEAGSAQRLLNVGVGTGKEQRQIQALLPTGGLSFGLDLSGEMLKLTQQRVPQTHLCQAVAWQLPFANGRFDRILCTYVLDLLETAVLPQVLAECHRVLQPGGKLVLVSSPKAPIRPASCSSACGKPPTKSTPSPVVAAARCNCKRPFSKPDFPS